MNGKVTESLTIEDRSVSKTKYVNHVFRRVTGFYKKIAATKPIEINAEVIILSGGGLILPYFSSSRGKWKIVLVSQYRPSVKTITLEAAGGGLNSEPANTALSRELLEETGIKVNPQSIKIAVNEYTHPSILSSRFIGGIVRINQCMVQNKRKAGNKYENERTQVEVFGLVELIKKREANLITLDLMTSRLVDEVAKTVGLLVKNY